LTGLRLREPFAEAFAALGFEGEEGWRVAARIKVVLLTRSRAGKEEDATAEGESAADAETPAPVVEAPVDVLETAAHEAAPAVPAPDSGKSVSSEPAAVGVERVALSPALWRDPDVRWLTGVHEAQGHAYLVREPYEELLWWLLMPSLLRLAGDTVLNRAAIAQMNEIVSEALATAEAADYRIDALLGGPSGSDGGQPTEPEAERQSLEPEQPEADGRETDQAAVESPEATAVDQAGQDE